MITLYLATVLVLNAHLCSALSVEVVKSNCRDPEAAIVFIPAKDIHGDRYIPLAEEIIRRSDLKLWVTIFDEQPFLSDMPLAFLSAFTHLKTHGYKGMSTFLAGHGDGGIVAARFGLFSSHLLGGVLLYSSYLPGGSLLNKYPTPVLTVSGDLDGLTRVTKIVDIFEELQADIAQNPTQKYKTPVIVMEGVNFGQFAFGKLPWWYGEHDLTPEVSHLDAYHTIADYTSAFMVSARNVLMTNVTAAHAFLDQGYSNTQLLLQPLSQVKALDKNIELVSHWTTTAQQLIVNLLNSTSVEFVNHETGSENAGKEKQPNPSSLTDDLQIVSSTSIMFDKRQKDSAVYPQSPLQLKATMTSQEVVRKMIGTNQFGDPASCQDINQDAFTLAFSKSSRTAQSRYQAKGRPIKFLKDVNVSSKNHWNRAYLHLTYNTTGLFVGATRFHTTETNPDSSISGQDDCTLLSPYRVMEWIYIDALQNSKPQRNKSL
ncbi:Hypothetical predicted protein [Mytilus galloprovincialis]|uniref:Uncharacterized protein n=1 Tax=Mytilus galloprovincialis TaxID=29158 RepID=A0A8B6GN46_MYTGA|nr:Hypothetical predicted protein [Mytilus galloprovincialis]